MPTVAAATGQGLWLQALHRLLWICDVLACIRQERGYVDFITTVSEAHTHTHTACAHMHKHMQFFFYSTEIVVICWWKG